MNATLCVCSKYVDAQLKPLLAGTGHASCKGCSCFSLVQCKQHRLEQLGYVCTCVENLMTLVYVWFTLSSCLSLHSTRPWAFVCSGAWLFVNCAVFHCCDSCGQALELDPLLLYLRHRHVNSQYRQHCEAVLEDIVASREAAFLVLGRFDSCSLGDHFAVMAEVNGCAVLLDSLQVARTAERTCERYRM